MAVAEPSASPAQETLVVEKSSVSNGGSVSVAAAVKVHPAASVTTTVYVPGPKPLMVDVVAPVFQE